MKNIIRPTLIAFFLMQSLLSFSQCNESSASKDETKQFIKNKIASTGGSFISTYVVKFTGDSILDIFETSDTDTSNYWHIDFTKVGFDKIWFKQKKKGKIQIYWKGPGLKQNSNLGFTTLEFDNEISLILKLDVPDGTIFFNKFTKALRHLACLNGNKYYIQVEDKF